MKFKVLIKNNITGEERLCDTETHWTKSTVFWIKDGNFCCDCNREMLFENDDSLDPPCGFEKYRIIEAVLDNGIIVEIEGREK